MTDGHGVSQKAGAVVLAAGLARRMGTPKVLLPWRDGETILDRILSVLWTAEIDPVIVVTGHVADRVAAIATAHGATSAFNPDYAAGEMLSSLKTGLAALPDDIGAALIVLGDQPRIDAGVVRQVVTALHDAPIAAPSCQMRRGHPIAIARVLWGEIEAIAPDGTLREVIHRHAEAIAYVNVEEDSVLGDVDTPEQYAAERAKAGLPPHPITAA